MEDNGRELSRNQANTPDYKDGYKSSKELTIMLIGRVGKIRSFKISRKLIIFTSIFLILYFVISLAIFYLYFDLFTTFRARSNQMQILETELVDKTRALEQNELYIKGLEEFYNSVQRGEEGKADRSAALRKIIEKNNPEKSAPGGTKPREALQKGLEEKKDTGAALKKAPEPREPDLNITGESKNQETSVSGTDEKGNADKTQKKDPGPASPETNVPGKEEDQAGDLTEAVEDYMEIRDIDFKKTDSVLTLDFKLANKLDDKKAAEGYIHIIVMNKDKEYPPEWNSDYNKISGGFPVDYKHGQQFLIRSFRPYQRQYSKDSDSELPSFIRILVYDTSGKKILEKEFSVR